MPLVLFYGQRSDGHKLGVALMHDDSCARQRFQVNPFFSGPLVHRIFDDPPAKLTPVGKLDKIGLEEGRTDQRNQRGDNKNHP